MITLILFVLVVAASTVYLYMRFFYRGRRPNEPPIVAGHLLWGSGAEFSEHAVNFLHKAQKEYGDIFTIRLLHQHLTILMDPHNVDTFSREKKFDFDVIQKQVNMNVFSFELVDARRMIKEAGRTVRGNSMLKGMRAFSQHLDEALETAACTDQNANCSPVENNHEWRTDNLRHFTSRTIFAAIFYTIFGRDGHNHFEPMAIYKNFDMYHKYFNYLWLGVPVKLFPKALEALRVLVQQPSSDELLRREDLSDYIRYSLEFMKSHGQQEAEMIGHNLVFLHVNYNTFRLAFWAIYKLMEHPEAWEALRAEVQQSIDIKRRDNPAWADDDEIIYNIDDIEDLPILDSVVNETIRLSSGVFMVRYVTEDCEFTMSNGKTYNLREGDRVAMYPPAIHKDPEIYEDPTAFKYDRFVNQKFYKNGEQLKHPVMGFGTICPGKRFAMLQAKWFLFVLTHRFELKLQKGEHTELDIRYHGHEILPPTGEVQIDYRTRDTDKLRLCLV